MPSAMAAAPESSSSSPPPASKCCRRQSSPLANGTAAPAAAGEFELRHCWTPKRSPRRRMLLQPALSWSPPPEIEIPNGGGEHGGGGGYTSLRDILSSPKYAACSPAGCAAGGGSCGDIHMIRHPLVKHAAFTYLQMTPSMRVEDAGGRRRRWRGPLCRLLLGCLSFIGALFRP